MGLTNLQTKKVHRSLEFTQSLSEGHIGGDTGQLAAENENMKLELRSLRREISAKDATIRELKLELQKLRPTPKPIYKPKPTPAPTPVPAPAPSPARSQTPAPASSPSSSPSHQKRKPGILGGAARGAAGGAMKGAIGELWYSHFSFMLLCPIAQDSI